MPDSSTTKRDDTLRLHSLMSAARSDGRDPRAVSDGWVPAMLNVSTPTGRVREIPLTRSDLVKLLHDVALALLVEEKRP